MNETLASYRRAYLLSGRPEDAVKFADAVIRAENQPDVAPRQRTAMTIPTIGTELTLAEDWIFPLYRERRNRKFWEKFHPDTPFGDYWGRRPAGDTTPEVVDTILPKGTVLKVSRIYIRQGVTSFDSVTFTVVKHPGDKKLKGRFWAKLEDVNQMFVNWELLTLKGVGV